MTMTPQERELVEKLFDKLSALENNPRDKDAEQTMAAGLARAPHAVYALVQTVLVQDEALKQADQKIAALEAERDETSQHAQDQQGGFLYTMRDAVLGRSTPQRGAVPAAGGANRSVWGNAPGYTQPGNSQPGYSQPGYAQAAPGGYAAAPQVGQGGSFLGTAAAAAAGMVGGSLLMNSFRSMFGGAHNPQAFGQDLAGRSGQDRSPWSDASNSDLAQQAGINNIGSGQDSGQNSSDDGNDRGVGLFDTADSNTEEDVYETDDGDDDFDSGGYDSYYA
jgi:hypothetical protein